LISGYQGAAGMNLALERGEIEAVGANAWENLLVTKPEWIKDGKITALFQTTLTPDPKLGNVPRFVDLATEDRARAVITFEARSEEIGYYLIAPPGTPDDLVSILRTAFTAMAKDAAYLDDAKRQNMGTNYLGGRDLQDIAVGEAATPASVIAQFRAAATPKR
jgi:hypothetical protein